MKVRRSDQSSSKRLMTCKSECCIYSLLRFRELSQYTCIPPTPGPPHPCRGYFMIWTEFSWTGEGKNHVHLSLIVSAYLISIFHGIYNLDLNFLYFPLELLTWCLLSFSFHSKPLLLLISLSGNPKSCSYTSLFPLWYEIITSKWALKASTWAMLQ